MIWVRTYTVGYTYNNKSDYTDLMVEAKDKEQAVLHLYRIYNLQPVIHGACYAKFIVLLP